MSSRGSSILNAHSGRISATPKLASEFDICLETNAGTSNNVTLDQIGVATDPLSCAIILNYENLRHCALISYQLKTFIHLSPSIIVIIDDFIKRHCVFVEIFLSKNTKRT